jgi:GST-like protein
MRARMALEECGLAYTLHPVALAKGEHKTPQFLAMNPNAQIPVIVDGPGGKPLTLMSASTDITPVFGALFAVLQSKEPHAPSAQLFRERLRQFFQVWDERLGAQKYAAGSALTVADFSLFAGYARIKGAAPEVLAGLPHLERWASEMGARPAMQRALQF